MPRWEPTWQCTPRGCWWAATEHVTSRCLPNVPGKVIVRPGLNLQLFVPPLPPQPPGPLQDDSPGQPKQRETHPPGANRMPATKGTPVKKHGKHKVRWLVGCKGALYK
jgi:hypothetical protein